MIRAPVRVEAPPHGAHDDAPPPPPPHPAPPPDAEERAKIEGGSTPTSSGRLRSFHIIEMAAREGARPRARHGDEAANDFCNVKRGQSTAQAARSLRRLGGRASLAAC